MTPPLILEIKGNCLDDGPGIRSVVFFKGCPLDCIWCHNPESKGRHVEISYDAARCIDCKTCIAACREGAVSDQNPYFVDREKCTLGFDCEAVCPTHAISRVGTVMSVDEILARVMKDRPFFETSGGGVTLSGGEPTRYAPFVSELMKSFKKEGIHVLLETCGHFNYNTFMERVYPYADTIFYDIKLMDPAEHKRCCGKANDLILENFILLNQQYQKGGIEILPRTPLIPGITDTEKNLSALAQFYIANGVSRAALLAYNPLWHEKNHKIGYDNPLSRMDRMTTWLPRAKELDCQRILTDAGIDLV